MEKNGIYKLFLSSLMVILFLSVNAQPEKRVLSFNNSTLSRGLHPRLYSFAPNRANYNSSL